jgi:hypothetical protein
MSNSFPFAAGSSEHAEYVSFMEDMADKAESETPDMEPPVWEVSEEEEAYWASRGEEVEDRYLDSMWEDRAEMGMGGY